MHEPEMYLAYLIVRADGSTNTVSVPAPGVRESTRAIGMAMNALVETNVEIANVLNRLEKLLTKESPPCPICGHPLDSCLHGG